MARDYKARFYTDSSNLKGYLKTEQKVTPEYAKQAKNDWKAQGTAADVKVLGNNLTYVPLDMKPADLQFLETQKFDTTQIARLLGIPASIMLAAVDGSNLTYSNIEQSWIEFRTTRFRPTPAKSRSFSTSCCRVAAKPASIGTAAAAPT